jgi:hypothetical protein
MPLNKAILVFVFLILMVLQGQAKMRQVGSFEKGFYLDKQFIENNFEGGYEGYTAYFEKALTFPEKSYKNKVEGLMLFYFVINPSTSKAEVTFLTYLDQYIEDNIKEAVQGSRKLWKMKSNEDFRFYQPIIYSLLPYYPHTLDGDLPELPVALPLKFLQMFALIKSKRINTDFDFEKQDSSKVKPSDKDTYTKALAVFNSMMERGKPEYAYDALNEAIRYNPLKKEFLMKRIEIENQLRLNRYQNYDVKLLDDFLANREEEDYESDRVFNFGNISSNALVSPDETSSDVLKYGMGAYIEILNSTIQYPISSIKDKMEGAAIVEIKVNPDGTVESKFLTRLNDEMEAILKNVVAATTNQWVIKSEAYSVYQTIFFSLDHSIDRSLSKNLEGYPKTFNLPWLKPRSIRVFEQPDFGGLLPSVGVSTDEFPPNLVLPTDDVRVKDYKKLLNQYTKNKEKGKDSKAYENLNELIRYNPFDSVLILERMNLEGKLGLTGFKAYDEALIAALKQFN